MLNKVTLIGNLTRDPEESALKDGTTVTNFSIAVNRRIGEGVDFFNCTCFGKLAEIVAEYTEKGSKVAVAGRIQLDVVEYEDDSKRTFVKIIADEVEFLNSKPVEDEDEKPAKATKKAKKK